MPPLPLPPRDSSGGHRSWLKQASGDYRFLYISLPPFLCLFDDGESTPTQPFRSKRWLYCFLSFSPSRSASHFAKRWRVNVCVILTGNEAAPGVLDGWSFSRKRVHLRQTEGWIIRKGFHEIAHRENYLPIKRDAAKGRRLEPTYPLPRREARGDDEAQRRGRSWPVASAPNLLISVPLGL